MFSDDSLHQKFVKYLMINSHLVDDIHTGLMFSSISANKHDITCDIYITDTFKNVFFVVNPILTF